jgi:MinD-like ATPase involved in chromosome partitioning or flagellar assembly
MIITVWGSSGSGKSTLAVQIALALTRRKNNVILIDTNFVVPQCCIWFPRIAASGFVSLSTVLESEITPESLSRQIYLIDNRLGVLGYSKGELSMNSLIQRYDTAASLLYTASGISDYVVVDCQTNITQDHLTYSALEMAGCKLIVCTPDLRGVSFWMSNVPMLADSKYNIESSIRILNMVNSISPINAVEQQIGSAHYIFPFDQAAEKSLIEGTLGKKSGYDMSKPYNRVFGSLVERILNEL